MLSISDNGDLASYRFDIVLGLANLKQILFKTTYQQKSLSSHINFSVILTLDKLNFL